MSAAESTIEKTMTRSRAECLMLMDKLMRHLNDENDVESWLMNGVPDGGPDLDMTEEQFEYYEQFTDDFEDLTKVFARIVRRVCFKTRCEPKGFC